MAKVLLISFDLVGLSMAGPGIRYWEFAKALAPHHEVTLLVPKPCDKIAEGFKLVLFDQMRIEISKADVVVCQRLTSKIALWRVLYGPKFIIDAYDPEPLEHLEIFKALSIDKRKKLNQRIISMVGYSLESADGIIAANSAQRDLWLGLILGKGKINPLLYDEDPTLKNTLIEVPFGLSSTPPRPTKEGMREKFGLNKEDTVLLWGGGIWNWFDPLTLIKAIHKLSLEKQTVKLVFMGIKHPNSDVPEMEMTLKAVQLAEELKLTDKYVFFNFGWTPYEERQSFLMQADIGVSSHFEHLETRYAFRTRMLDYLWANLPVICTEGDYFAQKLSEEKVGISVGYQNVDEWVLAIKRVMANSENFRQNSKRVASEFTWPLVTIPLINMITALSKKPKNGFSFKEFFKLFMLACKLKNPFTRS